MPSLRPPASLARLLGNFALGTLGAAMFFGAIYLTALEDTTESLQNALEARAAAADGDESRLQRAARAVCNDHPDRDGRAVEPRWTPDGQLECQVVIAQEVAQ